MLPRASSYDELRSRFRWDIPEYYNIGVDVCDRWADREPDRLALIDVGEDGDRSFNYGRSARALQPDRQSASRPQHCARRPHRHPPAADAETAYTHIAAYKLGGIAIPLFTLFGEEALSTASAIPARGRSITNREGAEKLASCAPAARAGISSSHRRRQPMARIDFHASRAAQTADFTSRS